MGRDALKSPRFQKSSKLARYVPDRCLSGDAKPRVSSVAFHLNPGEEYLSVNSLEIESTQQIAKCYLALFGTSTRGVPLCTHKIAHYLKSAKDVGLIIAAGQSSWEFVADGKQRLAFTHDPIQKQSTRPASPSHCGVRFVRFLDELQQRKFARGMARLAALRFHLGTR
jgi:hypothetical protein